MGGEVLNQVREIDHSSDIPGLDLINVVECF